MVVKISIPLFSGPFTPKMVKMEPVQNYAVDLPNKLKNGILQKMTKNSSPFSNIKCIHFIYVYDKVLIAHHISSSNLP